MTSDEFELADEEMELDDLELEELELEEELDLELDKLEELELEEEIDERLELELPIITLDDDIDEFTELGVLEDEIARIDDWLAADELVVSDPPPLAPQPERMKPNIKTSKILDFRLNNEYSILSPQNVNSSSL